MDPKMKAYLQANHSLAADASDDDATAAFNALTPEQQTACKASMSAPTPATATQLAARNNIVIDDGDRLLALEQKRVTQLAQLGKTSSTPRSVFFSTSPISASLWLVP